MLPAKFIQVQPEAEEQVPCTLFRKGWPADPLPTKLLYDVWVALRAPVPVLSGVGMLGCATCRLSMIVAILVLWASVIVLSDARMSMIHVQPAGVESKRRTRSRCSLSVSCCRVELRKRMHQRRAGFMRLLQAGAAESPYPVQLGERRDATGLPSFKTVIHTSSFIHAQQALLDQLVGTLQLLSGML